ncbi:MAG: DUF1801 domain-containing protein [Bacteroides sp.]|nr:DUF1801 domain-containing protein [Bacteroides sp.]
MKEDPDQFYLSLPEPQRGTLLALRSILLSYDKDISETRKYGMPCFLYKRKILCYLWTDRKTEELYILMAEGRHLTHLALEQGSRARMKILRIDPGADIPVDAIGEVLREAIGLYYSR